MSFAGDTVQPGPVPAETWLSFLICEVWIIIELLSESPREEAGKSRVKCLTGGCYCYRCHRTYLGLPWVSRETSGTFRTSVGLENTHYLADQERESPSPWGSLEKTPLLHLLWRA